MLMFFLNVGKLWDDVRRRPQLTGDGTLVISVGVHVVASCSDSHWMKMMKAANLQENGARKSMVVMENNMKKHMVSWLVVWNHGNLMTFHWEYSSQLTNSYFSEG